MRFNAFWRPAKANNEFAVLVDNTTKFTLLKSKTAKHFVFYYTITADKTVVFNRGIVIFKRKDLIDGIQEVPFSTLDELYNLIAQNTTLGAYGSQITTNIIVNIPLIREDGEEVDVDKEELYIDYKVDLDPIILKELVAEFNTRLSDTVFGVC